MKLICEALYFTEGWNKCSELLSEGYSLHFLSSDNMCCNKINWISLKSKEKNKTQPEKNVNWFHKKESKQRLNLYMTYIMPHVSVSTVENSIVWLLQVFARKLHSASTSSSNVHAVCEKGLPCFTYFHLHLDLEFSPKQFEGTCSKAAVWIIHGLPVTVCMTAASTRITHLISTGFPRAWMHAHVQKHSCSLKIARPERSVPPCLPAAEMDCLFDCFRASERNFFDDCWHLCGLDAFRCGSQHLWLPQL